MPRLPVLSLIALGFLLAAAEPGPGQRPSRPFSIFEAVSASPPTPRFRYPLDFLYTGFGTFGCEEVFGERTALAYKPGRAIASADPGERTVDIPFADFSLNASFCGASGRSFVTKERLPADSSLGLEFRQLAFGFEGIDLEFAIALVAGHEGPVSEVACSKGGDLVGDVALGDQVHFVLEEDYSRLALDPRKGTMALKAGNRYALLAIGLAARGEVLCLMDAGEDSQWKLLKERGDKGKGGKSGGGKKEKSGIGAAAIGGIGAVAVVVVAVCVGLVAWWHLRKRRTSGRV